MLRSSTLA